MNEISWEGGAMFPWLIVIVGEVNEVAEEWVWESPILKKRSNSYVFLGGSWYHIREENELWKVSFVIEYNIGTIAVDEEVCYT